MTDADPIARAIRSRCCIATLLVGCAANATVSSSVHAQEPFPGIDAYVAKAMAAWKVPGLSLAIVRNDSVLFTKGYGVQKVGTTTPVDDRTLFEIGSSSKSFTATLVAMLVSDGKMRWDDPVTAYLPSFRLYDPVASAELTIRDALTHRSGLSRGELSWMAADISREEVLRRVRFLKPSWGFRSRWGYQNIMYLAAGEAAAKVSGSTWEDLIQRRIFDPLEMRSSVPVARQPDRLSNFASPHGMTHDTVYATGHMNIDDMAPAGSIVSTARDMAQWLRFQLSGGVYRGQRLVSSAALRETHMPQMLIGGGLPADDSVTVFNTYGMGWIVQDYRHALVWQHGGNTDGMTTAMGVLPDHKFGVVVLSNMAGAQLPDLLMRWLFDRELGAPTRDLSAQALARYAVQRRRVDSLERVQLAGRPAGAQPPLPLAAFTGTYTDSLYGEGTVGLEGGQLFFARGGWKAPLQYWNYGNFRWGPLASAVVPALFVKFDVTPDGRVTGLSFALGQDVVNMTKKEAPTDRTTRRPQ